MTPRKLALLATVCAPAGDFRPWDVADPGPCIRCGELLVILPDPDGHDWIYTHRRQLGLCACTTPRRVAFALDVEPGLFPDPAVRVPPECCGWPMRYAPRGWNCRINTGTWIIPTFEGTAARD